MATQRRTVGGKVTAAERAYHAIRQAVVDGRFREGEHLAEVRLGEEFGFSRTPVHAALQRLSAEGFVAFSPHAGAVVKAWSRRELEEIFDIRARLESMAAGLAATHATDGDVEQLARLTDAYEEASRAGAPMPRPSELNWQFHMKILEIAGNGRLQGICENLMMVGVMFRTFSRFERRDVERSLQDHRSLVRAIETRNAEWASAIMKCHILIARDMFAGWDGADAAGVSGRAARGRRADGAGAGAAAGDR